MADAIIAVGGTGKRAALLYLKLVNTLRPSNVIAPGSNVFVVDMEPEPNTPDAQLDQDLIIEGVPSSHFVSPVREDARVDRTITLSRFMNFGQGASLSPLARTLFSDNQLEVQIIKGMNCEPTVGATVAARRFSHINQEPEIQQLENGIAPYDRVLVVGSVIGGTGAGVTPQLVSWIHQRSPQKPVYGLLYLRWIQIPQGAVDEPSDVKMLGNSKAWLNYLLDYHPENQYGVRGELFKHYVLVGTPQGMRLNTTGSNSHHPIHLLGAVYLLQFDQFLEVAPGATGPHYLELSEGISPNKVRMGDDTMASAIVREKTFSYLLSEFKQQSPDEALSAFTLMLPTALAWRPFINTLEKVAAKWNRRRERHLDWIAITNIFDRERKNTEDRIEELKKLTATMEGADEIFNFDWNLLLQQSDARKADARELVKRQLKEVAVSFPNLEQAVEGIARSIIDQVREILRRDLKAQ